MKKLILLDAGHGGIIEGQYVTDGKRYYGKHDGQNIQLSEGAYNRAVVHGIAARLHLNGTSCHIINPENEDISLRSRVYRVNQLCDKYDCFLLSIHHNAHSNPLAYGTEFFTSSGETKSDAIAEKVGESFTMQYPYVKLRRQSISEYSKDAPFYVLEKTRCPAILSEWGFMTNDSDRVRIIEMTDQQIKFWSNSIENIVYPMI